MKTSNIDYSKPIRYVDGTRPAEIKIGSAPDLLEVVAIVDGNYYKADGTHYCGYHPAVEQVSEPVSSSLTEDDTARNELPMFDGLLAYFPNALAYVSTISKIGNDQHNPGEPLHWARGKSTDHLNKIVRHTVDAGKKDARGVRHSGRLAWRALANLQEELEREEGAPMSRGSYS